MKKKAFTLIEVIISITLMSFVIVLLLNLKEQNLFLVEKAQESQEKSAYFSSFILSSTLNKISNENIYLSDVLSFPKYENNNKLKNFKIGVKTNELNREEYEINGLTTIEFKKYETLLSGASKQKKYYFFKINE